MVTKYICIEGGEGTYKTTTINELKNILESQGKQVLVMKEPGTEHSELSMILRDIALNEKWKISRPVREMLQWVIRGITNREVVHPAMESGEYDYIIQDRGILSGFIYGMACENSFEDIMNLMRFTLGNNYNNLADVIQETYDKVIILENKDGLNIAKKAKKEFSAGDAMENLPESKHDWINSSFATFAKNNPKFTKLINVENKTPDFIASECIDFIDGWSIK